MNKPKQTKTKLEYQQLERQHKAMRNRLYRMIDALEGRPVDRRKYQSFQFGALEKVIENRIRGVEDLARSLVTRIEKKVLKHRPWDKKI